MTSPLLIYNSFWNSRFYEYLKEINSDVIIYYYPRLGTFLKDFFSSIELNEKADSNTSSKKYIFQPFFFDNSENFNIHAEENLKNPTVLYIIPPDKKILSLVIANIQNIDYNSTDKTEEKDKIHTFSGNRIIFFPRKTEECISWLNEHNSQNNYIFVDKNFVEFDFLPIDEKVFLIPLIDFFYKVFEKQDFSHLQICADTLTKIQYFYGKIPKVIIHGHISKKIYDIFLETSSKISNNKFPSDHMFNNLIIIDRTTDLLTPLLPQNSFNGFIEEAFTLDSGMISISNDDQSAATEHPITHKMTSKICYSTAQELNSNARNDQKHEIEIKNQIHDYLKYRMVHHDIDYLKTILESIKMHRFRLRKDTDSDHQNLSINGKAYDNCDIDLLERSAQSLLKLIENTKSRISKYDSYMELRGQLELGLQLNFESFTKTIQTFLYAEENALFATQLIMAWCMINGGVPKSIYDEFCDEIEFRYGSQASEQLYFLERIHLITANRTANTFANMKKVFNLEEHEKINKKVTKEHQIFPVDFSSKIKSDGYDGYVPLSVRIIQEDLETIPGSITKRIDDQDQNNEKRNLGQTSRNNRKLSYTDMLSSTVGSTFMSLTDSKPKGMKLIKKYFDDQYFCQNGKYVNSDEIESETFSEDDIKDKENTLVFFVGGVTQLELAWLNWLTERHFKGRSNIFVLTTGMITADRFIKECLPCLREDHPSLKVMTDNVINLYSSNHY